MFKVCLIIAAFLINAELKSLNTKLDKISSFLLVELNSDDAL